ncbi:MAG: hypothetical protein NVSMB9_24680 [Isosphaeraceae bacterium]
MQRPCARFTLGRLMAIVSALALGLAVLRHAWTDWGPREVMTIAPTILLATNVLAWFQRARWQRFWVGFGLCGWAYLTFSLGSPFVEHLPTAWFLDGLHDRLYGNQPIPARDNDFGEAFISAKLHGDSFRRAGQSIFSLLFALLGGGVAIVLIPMNAGDEDEPLPPEGSLLKPGWSMERNGPSQEEPRTRQ